MNELSFIIGGAPRSGTGFLTAVLDRHPDLWLMKPFVPEPKLFILPEENSAEAYRAEIDRRTRDAPAGKLLGEKTSYYFESPVATRRIARTLPTVKLIFILREPGARAFSNFLWSRKNGLEDRSFEAACATEGSRTNSLPPEKSYVRPHAYLDRGRYGTHAQRWIESIGRDRILFVLFEQLVATPGPVLARVQDFLGVSRQPLEHERLDRPNVSDPSAPPVSPELVLRLRSFFADEVARFARLSGEDVSLWSD